jgi:hypothetical protein
VIVDGVSEPLFAAQVSLRGLDADVTKQELDLLKLTTCLVDTDAHKFGDNAACGIMQSILAQRRGDRKLNQQAKGGGPRR